MSLKGVSYQTKQGTAKKAVMGLVGVRVELPQLPVAVKVIDLRGRGRQGINIHLDNPTSGEFTTTTDAQGNAFVIADNPSTLTVSIGFISNTYAVTNETQITITLDHPLLK